MLSLPTAYYAQLYILSYLLLKTTIMGGWWVVDNYTDNKAISAQLSWSWGWG